ncbi:hypothetical protein P7D52_12195 [Enterococcus dongliensis]|uniref:hypothetical protein n=2 Tax=Enterococcus dongliensis TaxID=2559925 RepID=UPI00288DAE58|nr:hypothetical protein [Enterococcus dongliensis]MDT2643542.1 hypothetical protein [Enterococcus dongliensis]MDT2677831.1 hypothetical protein [Enterococcus dongliensis]
MAVRLAILHVANSNCVFLSSKKKGDSMMTKKNGIIVLFTAFTMVFGLATNSPVSYAEENGNSLNAVDENRFSELVEGFHENDFIRAGEYVEALPNFSELSLEELDVLVAIT